MTYYELKKDDGSIFIGITISQFDLVRTNLSEFTKLRMRLLQRTNKISKKILALWILIQKIEKREKR